MRRQQELEAGRARLGRRSKVQGISRVPIDLSPDQVSISDRCGVMVQEAGSLWSRKRASGLAAEVLQSMIPQMAQV